MFDDDADESSDSGRVALGGFLRVPFDIGYGDVQATWTHCSSALLGADVLGTSLALTFFVVIHLFPIVFNWACVMGRDGNDLLAVRPGHRLGDDEQLPCRIALA